MSRGLHGIVKRGKLLAMIFIFQGFVNLVSFGITPYMMIVPVTRHLPPIFVYVEPAFVLVYPSLGALGILLLSKASELGRRISTLYLGIGTLGSLMALVDCLCSPRGPDWLEVFLSLSWFLTSLVGLYLVRGMDYLPPVWVTMAVVLLVLSAFLGFGLAYLVAEDYYYHAIVPKPPENATVIVAYPENVSPPGGTG